MPRLQIAAAAALFFAALQPANSQNLIISSSLPQSHLWVQGHLDPFVSALEDATDGGITFTYFANGELTSVGRELDALQSATIHVAAPLLAPYHEGAFPLSDVTQLPTYGTNSPMVTRAFQALLDSDIILKDGKTFYQYEIGSKGIRAWAIGATSAYVISTNGQAPREASQIKGKPLRAGSAIHTIFLNEIGATPVTMPAVSVFEALSRGTVTGLVLAIADWNAYSLKPVIKDSITDLAIGHWESYLAISEEGWNQLDDAGKAAFDQTARQVASENAALWEEQVVSVTASAKERGASFTSIEDFRRCRLSWLKRLRIPGKPGSKS